MERPPRRLLIRADASASIGMGHVMRCAALAQAWRESRGEATLAAARLPDGLKTRLEAEGLPVRLLDAEPGGDVDSRSTAELAREFGAAWTVIDGYVFGDEYQKMLKAAEM